MCPALKWMFSRILLSIFTGFLAFAVIKLGIRVRSEMGWVMTQGRGRVCTLGVLNSCEKLFIFLSSLIL